MCYNVITDIRTTERSLKMIVYNKLLSLMKEKGLTTYKIRQNNVISQRAIASITHGGSITVETINKLCRALQCQPGDILEYVEDPPEPGAEGNQTK